MIEPVTYIVEMVPAPCLNPNMGRSAHWSELSSAIATLRKVTWADVKSQGVYRFEGMVDAHFCICWTQKHRLLKDSHNAHVMMKPVIDGLTDAGCWADDDQVRLVGVDQHLLTVEQRRYHRNGCILVALSEGVDRQQVSPLDDEGRVSQLWLEGLPWSAE